MTLVLPELTDLRIQCTVDDESEDAALLRAMNTAVIAVGNDINQDLECLADSEGNLPEPIQHAILIRAAGFFAHREPSAPVQLHAVPDGYQSLIHYYRHFGSRKTYTEESEEES